MNGFESPERIADLIIGHLQGTLDDAASKDLEDWLAQSADHRLEFEELTNPKETQASLKEIKYYKKQILDSIVARAPELTAPTVFQMKWWKMAAAVLVLTVGAAIYYWNYKNPKQQPDSQLSAIPLRGDALPGTNQATLTLSNGQTIILDSMAIGTIARQGAMQVVSRNGALTYDRAGETNGTNDSIAWNTISTRRGQQFPSVVLSDGTKVWLNAASSIHFPVMFVGKERRVSLTGEAYFEVAKNKNKPFIVTFSSPTGGGREGAVQVLGTHFNINAYDDEAVVKTTLLEGSVKIINGTNSNLLKPGQQAQVNNDGNIAIDVNADVEQSVAWKNGFFKFKQDNIETVMRQVARWYDVDIEFKERTTQTFNGTIPKSVSAATLFSGLEATGWVHFTIEGKKVIVH